MGLVYLDEGTSALTDIANAIRTKNGKTISYKPTEMAAAIRSLTLKPLYPFATATDAQLIEMVNAYYDGIITLDDVKSVWNVGDKRKISLSAMSATYVGESHVAQDQYFTLLDFDHDTLVTNKGTKTKALITLEQDCVLSNGTTVEGGYMNSTATNTGGWEGCARRTWCNNTYYNALPSAIKSLVKQVTKQNYKVYNSTTLTTTNDYCFLLSSTEIWDLGASNAVAASDTEGARYSFYALDSVTELVYDSHYEKYRMRCGHYAGNANTFSGGNPAYAWLRTPCVDSSEKFLICAGDAIIGRLADESRYMAPAFCI